MPTSALITTIDEFEAEYRKGVGYVRAPHGSREASIDNIRRFGDGVGDYNPLFRDPCLRREQPLRHDRRAAHIHLRRELGDRLGHQRQHRWTAAFLELLPDELRWRQHRFLSHDLARRPHFRHGADRRYPPQAQRTHRRLRAVRSGHRLPQPAQGTGGHQDHADGPAIRTWAAGAPCTTTGTRRPR